MIQDKLSLLFTIQQHLFSTIVIQNEWKQINIAERLLNFGSTGVRNFFTADENYLRYIASQTKSSKSAIADIVS
ncbi:hypothetical protein [Scytonema sp. PCC 10023]|uniref:hypothetical protein n=1 Tax=Scytonema sp. PCC 10023 TaxID=1680591 RepID=UPI0039C63BC2